MTHLYAVIGRQQKISNDCLHLSDLSDEEIFQTTRSPRIAVEQLHEMLRGDIEHPTARSNAVPAETQLLAALQFFATGSFQSMVGRSCGLSQSSVSLAISSVANALVKRASQFLTFPTDQHTLLANKLAFHAALEDFRTSSVLSTAHISP